MSSTCLDCQTKGTKIITSRLDDHIFSREELFSGEFFERADFRQHHRFFLLGGDVEVIWILWEYLYLLSIVLELMVYLEKSGIHDTISDIPTSGEEEFFLILDGGEDFFRVFHPLCFRLIGDDT